MWAKKIICPLTNWVTTYPQFQVFGPVIDLVSIPMMYRFTLLQSTIEYAFHHDAVFGHKVSIV